MSQENPIVNQEPRELEVTGVRRTEVVLGDQGTQQAIVVTSTENGKQIVNTILVEEVKFLIENAIQKIIPRLGFKALIVEELPMVGDFGIIYLVPNEETEGENIYDEYIWVVAEGSEEGSFEFLGSSSIDLSNYYTKTEINAMFVTLTQAQYDALVSGGTVNPDTYYFILEE